MEKRVKVTRSYLSKKVKKKMGTMVSSGKSAKKCLTLRLWLTGTSNVKTGKKELRLKPRMKNLLYHSERHFSFDSIETYLQLKIHANIFLSICY